MSPSPPPPPPRPEPGFDLRFMALIAAVVVAALAGMSALLWNVNEAGRNMQQIESRFLREHSMAVYMAQRDFLTARMRLVEAAAGAQNDWRARYEIAAGRLWTLEAHISHTESGPHEEAHLVARYRDFVEAADAAIAAAPDDRAAATALAALSAETEALFPDLIDIALRSTQNLRADLIRRNAEAVRNARLVAVVSVLALLCLCVALLSMNRTLRRRNSRLNAMRQELAEALEIRSRFLAGVSHDFRTPLNAISGFAQILLHAEIDTPPDKRRRFLGQILEASRRLERMTRDLLDLARMERGAYLLRPENGVDLGALSLRVVRGFAPVADEAGIRLIGPAAGRTTLRIDAPAMERALSNLIDNALKFSEPGGAVTVAVIEAEDEARGDIVLEVRDEGPGIPSERQAEIWDLFGRGGLGPGKERQGSGLGLAITRGIVEAHGGRMTLESAPGRGSCFAIRLPGALAGPQSAPAPAPHPAEPAAA